ncbi:hypothetical protein JCM10908_004292 [Rhodotorula pacifica]|uniref:CFEM domain-containing protein n=1 Tax=Rhodotorula pacifica TaxID=1495444 RepID=UPI0031741E99
MRPYVVIAAAVAMLPALVSAQSAPPPCVINCIGQTAALTSCASADNQCLCSSETFIQGVSSCMVSTCSAEELATGVAFGEALCQSVGVSVSIPSSLAAETARATATSEVSIGSSFTVTVSSVASSASASASSAAASASSVATASSPASSTSSAAGSVASPTSPPSSGSSVNLMSKGAGAAALIAAGAALAL